MKKLKKIGIIFLLPIMLLGCAKEKEIARSDFLMNTIANIHIFGNDDENVMDQVYKRLFDIEKTMSKTIGTSDISKINKSAGIKKVRVDKETLELVKVAKDLAEKTHGNFDPTIGPLVNLWDISSSEEARDWLPDNKDIQDKLRLVNYKDIVIEDEYVYLTRKDMELDLGGIAKGYGADQAMEYLKDQNISSALIDLGGNIYALGKKTNGEDWRVGIKDPDAGPNNYIGILRVSDKSVVTSGGYERFFELDGNKYHHILDPETGYPAVSDIKSVTIVDKSSTRADALATAVYVLGLSGVEELLEGFEDLGLIIVSNDGKIYISEELEGSFELKDDNYNIITLGR